MTRSNRLIATVSAAVLAAALSADAFAQLQLTPQPPPAKKTESGVKQRQESKKKAATAAKKTAPAEQKAKAADKAKTPAKSVAKPPEAEDDPHLDLAYGAYQRGAYGDALRIATRRAEAGDPKAMTLLGELYSNGYGVNRDDKQALDWYKQAADRGDREATFALAMMRIAGRGAPANREEGAKLLAFAAKLGSAPAAYNLGLLNIEGQVFPRDMKRAAELFRQAADAGNPEAQYALATFYKEGQGGLPKDAVEATRLLRAAATADNLDAQVEYAIALFNGTGTAKDEAGAVALLWRASRRGSPIAQNRLARVLATGIGAPKDLVEALKWHLIAKAGGNGDPVLDEMLALMSADSRAKAEEAAKQWFRGKTHDDADASHLTRP
ncbi:MAG: tetratricopeptide repeat protein [Xanthobacteraceae bacterium]